MTRWRGPCRCSTLSILRTPVLEQNVGNVGALVLTQLDRYSCWWDVNNNCIDDYGQEHTAIDHVLVTDGTANKPSRSFERAIDWLIN